MTDVNGNVNRGEVTKKITNLKKKHKGTRFSENPVTVEIFLRNSNSNNR